MQVDLHFHRTVRPYQGRLQIAPFSDKTVTGKVYKKEEERTSLNMHHFTLQHKRILALNMWF